jgi:hypothetical protein
VVTAQNGSVAYIFQPQSSSSQAAFSWLNTSGSLNAKSRGNATVTTPAFLSDTENRAFNPVSDGEGIAVISGNCRNTSTGLQLWRYSYGSNGKEADWKEINLTTSDSSLSARFLSAGFTFSPTNSVADASLYIFGGMCPNQATEGADDWTSDATYSNTMLTIGPETSSGTSSPYQLSLTGVRAPPITEAGLTITPLTPTFSNTTESNVSQQQNFVLLGGHTQNAFVNMSQLALFSLPQESWTFVNAAQPNTNIEPRSGHTAILTEDGSQLIVLGGWVGDVNTPAQPQLIVLEVAQEYGGQSEDWAWSTPKSGAYPFPADGGIYGHGVAMLPGGIMMVTGGYSIGSSSSKAKRDAGGDMYFMDTVNLQWSNSYTNPYASSISGGASSEASSSGLKPSAKAGLGAGLGLGLAAAAVIVIVWLLYSRRLRKKRALREKELRAMALGAERYHTPLPPREDDQRYPGRRSASWNAAQEDSLESSGDPFPWAPMVKSSPCDDRPILADGDINKARNVARTGMMMEVPSPTRGLRKSLNARGQMTYQPFNQHPPLGPGSVFPIVEEDEGSHGGSFKQKKTAEITEDSRSVESDPFGDPALAAAIDQHDPEAARRKREVEGWVEDWQSAAESMTISRNTSQAHSRTYSNLSQMRNVPSNGGASGRGSPEKSDRTGSNLSEQSECSTSTLQRSAGGTISRNVSQRSASAGYALFSSAAAAIGRVGYSRQDSSEANTADRLDRSASKRSVSLNIDTGRHDVFRDGAETFSSARSRWMNAGEGQSLLNRGTQDRQVEDRDYRTLPESPSKDRYRAGSLTNSSRKALSILGSVRRVFTGTGSVDVSDRVAAIEGHSTQTSPTKSTGPEMAEATPKRTLSGGAGTFWRSKQGAKDWDDGLNTSSSIGPSSTVRRKPLPGQAFVGPDEPQTDEDWDVEQAAQHRVVQVMFTVPKEKLRVVNADALSLLSSNRSEVDQDEDKEREQVKRMSSVREGDEDYDDHNDNSKGKDKDRGW